MTRIFNIAMLCILAGIYYSQNGGFDGSSSANAAPTETQVQKAAKPAAPLVREPVALSNPVITAALTQTTDANPNPARPSAAKHPAMSKKDLTLAKSRFSAQKLTNSTVMRQVVLQSPTNVEQDTPENLLIVSGTIVNARERPTTQSQVLAKLARGTEVIATGERDGSWRQVVVVQSGDVVWMHRKFLKAGS